MASAGISHPTSRSNSGLRSSMGLSRTLIGSAIAGSFTSRTPNHRERTADLGMNAHQTSDPLSRKRFCILGCWSQGFLVGSLNC